MLSTSIRNLAAKLLMGGERLWGTPTSATDESLRRLSSFLILEYSRPLGNAVHASPIFEALHEAVPGAFIAVACSGMSFQVHQHNPFIQQVIQTSSPYQNPVQAAKQIRASWKPPSGRSSCILTPVGSERTKIGATAFLAGAGLRVGYTLLPELFHRVAVYDQSQSLLFNNLELLPLAGHSRAHYEPRVYFIPSELESARFLLRQRGLDDGQPIAVFVTQTSKTQYKRWRDERFIAMAHHLRDVHRCHVLFVGTAEEAAAIEVIQSGIGFPTVSLAGKTSIPVLSALLCLSDVAISLDTGIMHLARAAQLPTIIIAPAWSPVLEWLPLDNPMFHIHKNADLPCMTPDYIIDEVSVDEVRASVDRLLQTYPPSAEARHSRILRSLSDASAFDKSADVCASMA